MTKSQITFEALADEWLLTRQLNVKRNTYDGYVTKVTQQKIIFGSHHFSEMDYSCIQSYLNRLYSNGAAKNTIKKHLQVIRAVCVLAIKKEIISINPCALVEIPRNASETQRRELTPDEELLLFDAKWFFSDFALFLYYTGMRISEAIPLKWSDISFENNEIKLQRVVSYSHGKTYIDSCLKNKDKFRIIPMCSPLRELLACRKRNGDYIFPNTKGHIMARNTMRTNWNKFQSESKLYNITPHMLRHTFATNMYRAGIDLKTLQKITGHHDLAVLLKRYVHDDLKAIRASAALMDKFYHCEKTTA